jgi:hypothetical protein
MLAANRANARRSTGPRSEEGRNRLRFNGLRHGLRARSFRGAIVAMGGDPREFDLIASSYPLPQSKAELRQIEQLAYKDWLLRRNPSNVFGHRATKAGMLFRINKTNFRLARKSAMLL